MINSMPDGMNAWVLMVLRRNVDVKKPETQLKKIHAPAGLIVMSHSPKKTIRPEPVPMAKETILPFLNPKYPPTNKKTP